MTRPRSYKEIFQQRGNAYDMAMQLYPNARANEFIALVDRLPVSDGFCVLDMPSGGGYLSNYFTPNIDIVALDSCSTFISSKPENKSIIGAPNRLPFKNESFDALVSLAGLHHELDKNVIFKEMHRVLKKGARFCIADVHYKSAVAVFLDTVVDSYNSQGHEGLYLDNSTVEELNRARLQVETSEVVDFHWLFADTTEMVDFCRNLFGLDKINPEKFLQETIDTLGIQTVNKGIGLNWQLNYICGYAC